MWARIMREHFKAKNSAFLDDAFSYPDSRLDTDRAATGKQYRPHSAAGPGRGLGRHAIAAHQRYDEALALPTEQAARIALRTQQIVAYESGRAANRRPLAGSYLSNRSPTKSKSALDEYLHKIDALGGS